MPNKSLNTITQQVESFIQRHQLVQRGQHILVAVSGGADSVALLYLLHDLRHCLRLRLTVAHLNHQIRGAAADEDAAFVKKTARRLRLDCVCKNINVPRLARRKGISLEMAGRRARYEFFQSVALKHGCHAVATAHTSDDNAETMLLMLARGCGMPGLTGIPPRSQAGIITVIRPLLQTDRKTIESYLRERHIAWREDASNSDPAFLRNRARHELLPLLEKKFNPAIRRALSRLAEVLSGENEFLDEIACAIYAEACAESGRALDCAVVARHHVAVRRRVVRHWLSCCGMHAGDMDFQMINRIDRLLTDAKGERAFDTVGGITIRRQRRLVTLGKRKETAGANYMIRLAVPGRTILPDAGLNVTAEIIRGIWRKREKIGEYPATASFALTPWRRRKIFARTWRAGDRMHPYGLDGSKKIKDIFCDAKIPTELRHRLPIFECGGAIIWVPGYRIAQGWEITDSAENALRLTVERA